MTETGEGRAAPRSLVPVLVFIGMVTALVSSLGAPLLPTIARVDRVSLDEAQWSLTVTVLVGAVSSPIMGRLGDGPRRRPVILVALGVVALGGVLAGLPGGFLELVAGRALQGVGLGLMPLTMAVARDHLPEEQSRSAIAILSIAAAAGVGLGYPVTGLLDEYFGLHSAFWFGAAVAALALAISLPVLPPSPITKRHSLDVGGAILLGVGLTCFLVVMTEGQLWGWASPKALGLLAVAVVVGGAWVVWEMRAEHPLVRLDLLRHRAVRSANFAAFLIAAAMYMFLPLLTDYVQTPSRVGYGFGASVVLAGLMLLPFSVLSVSMSRVAAWFGRRVGERWVIPLGALVLAVAVGYFDRTGLYLWQGFVSMALAGIGVGFTFAAMPGLIVRSVPADETGSALGFYQVVRYVGFSGGSALAASLLAAYTRPGHQLPSRSGFVTAMAVGSGLCLVTAVLSLWWGRATPSASLVTDETEAGIELLVEESAVLGAAGVPMNTEDGTVAGLLGRRSPVVRDTARKAN
jgi:MFS family permease